MKNKTVRGFTLVELAVVLVVLTILAAASIPNLPEDFNRTRTNLTVGEIQSISEAARLYAHKHGGAWPGSGGSPPCGNAISDLQRDNYLKNIDGTSPWKTPYEISCDTYLFYIRVKTNKDWAGVIENSVHSTQKMGADITMTETAVVLPGSVPATQRLLHRFAEPDPALNRMETTLNMGGNNIDNAKNIGALSYYDIDNPNYFLKPSRNSVMYGLRSVDADDYAFRLSSEDGLWNAEPTRRRGSLSVNDIYLRSTGQWVSNISKGSHCGFMRRWIWGPGSGGGPLFEIPCQGYQLFYQGCPPGFAMGSAWGEVSNGRQAVYFCVKL